MIPQLRSYHEERADQDMEIELIRIAAEYAIRERELKEKEETHADGS